MSKQGDKEIADMKNGETSNSVPLKTVGDLKRVLENFSDNTHIQFWLGDCESWTYKYTLSIETNMYEDIDEGETVDDHPLYLALGIENEGVLDYIRPEDYEWEEMGCIEDVKDFITNKIRRVNMTITKTEFLDWWGSDHENVEELTELILELLNKKYKIDTCVQDIKQYEGE